MKKVGVLTLVFFNYGTRLQSYALSRILTSIKPDNVRVDIIDLETTWTDRPPNLMHLFFQIIKAYKLKSIVYIFNLIRWRKEKKKINRENHSAERAKRQNLFSFIINKIPYTSQKYSCDDIRNGILRDYDAIIVGSDQVWNGIKVRNQDVFGLNYFSKLKLTYAASFGMTTIPKELFPLYKKNINSFDSLLMREQEGVELCNALGRNDVESVLDPTLLLREKDYDSLVTHSEVNIQEDYVLVYSLNYSYKIYQQAHKVAKKNSCKMIVLKRSFCPPNVSKFDNSEELYAVSPEGFLWLIKHSKCIITNSYHALLFSVNFKRPFYLYLDNCDEENSRMHTIVRMLKLNNRVFWETQNLPLEIRDIDFDETCKILDHQRAQSIALLKKSLQKLV